MKKGVIVEQGKHESLIEAGGYYAQLGKAQEVRTESREGNAEIEEEVPQLHENILDANGNQFTSISLEAVNKPAADTKITLKPNSNHGFRRLFSMQTPDWFYISIGLIGAILNGLVMPLFALFFSTMLSVFAETNYDVMREEANFWALMFVILAIAGFISNFMQQAGFGVAGERLTMRIRKVSFRY
jgi:ATP-binding cassette subfamily B (MDR/TAP) protein 1